MLSLIFMLNLQILVTAISAQSATEEKKKKREKTGEENRMRGEDKRWIAKRQTLNRGNKSNQPIPSPAPTD